jgi:hypothetical protein
VSDEIRDNDAVLASADVTDAEVAGDPTWPASLDTISPVRAVDEGVMIALTAIRMAVKNRIIVGALRERNDYNADEYVAAARQEITALARQNDELATRLENRARAHAERLETRAALVAEQDARSAERDARAADKEARLAAEKDARASARSARRGSKMSLRPRPTLPAATPPTSASTTPAAPATPEPAATPPAPITTDNQSAESQRSELLRHVYLNLAADLRSAGDDSERMARLVESARQDAWSEVRQAWHAKLADQTPTDVGADYNRHREGRLLELVYIDLAALRHDSKRRLRKTHK